MLLQIGMSLCNIIHLDQSTEIIANSKSVIETVQKSNETLFHSVHSKVFFFDKVTWSGCKDGSVRILAISTHTHIIKGEFYKYTSGKVKAMSSTATYSQRNWFHIPLFGQTEMDLPI